MQPKYADVKKCEIGLENKILDITSSFINMTFMDKPP